jgi:IS5 family transposase
VLRESDPQTTIWELLLPEELKRLPAELARVDAYLDDERFIAPFRALFDRRLGRPSVPVESLLRLLYLRHRYQLGYEGLCREVSDSIDWRRFCRIGAGGAGAAPDHPGQAGTPRPPGDDRAAQRRAAGQADR